MHLSRALSALLAASVLTACASSAAAPSRKSTATPTPPSTTAPEASDPPLTSAQIARRSLLTAADFPKGWKVDTSAGDQLQCTSTTAAKKAASGTARGKAFANGPNTEMQSAAYVYKSTKVAKRHLQRLGGSATRKCLVEALKQAFTDTAGYKVGTIVTAPLDLGDTGDERLGTRITVPVSAKGVDADVLI